MEIYILSSGRASRQPTWNSLPPAIQKRTKLVVPKREAHEYRNYPIIHDPGVANVGAVRQWIMAQADDNFLMLDDDLTFATRRSDFPEKFHAAQPDDVRRAINEIESKLRLGAACVGIAMREGANRNTAPELEALRMARVYGYNLRIVCDHEIIFNRCLGMDDFDVALQLLRLGYPNIALNWIVQNQAGSNTAGGASQWRTLEVHKRSAELLKEYHPEYVTLVQKKTKTSWGGAERTDVIVQWKRALHDFRPR